MTASHSINNETNTLIISISGKFDFNVHSSFRASYKDITDKSLNVTVDLKHAEYMDSSALGMLLLLDEYFEDKRVKIINSNEYVKQVLGIACFDMKFDIL
jgi:HptB-dependent secretion and biofilm anti anti-sigma factor